MELKEVMEMQNFVIVGNTILEDKYAYKIKKALIDKGYSVRCVGKELKSINDVDFDIDVVDLCINPNIGIQILKECTRKIKVVVIQPGAESDEIKEFLHKTSIEYIEGCILVGLKLYKK